MADTRKRPAARDGEDAPAKSGPSLSAADAKRLRPTEPSGTVKKSLKPSSTNESPPQRATLQATLPVRPGPGQGASVGLKPKMKMADIVKSPSSEAPEVVTKWSDMHLKPPLLNGLIAMGFERPSAIQQRAIVPIIKGKDVICQSQSGTGKTAVFCLGALQIVRETSKACQAILLAPTRELAEQTGRVLASLGEFTKVKSRVCVGGKSMKDDIKALVDAQVISGTPGRVYDMVKRHHLDCRHVSLFAIDEADEMIVSGLKATIYDLFRELPNGVQVVLVSATMSAQVMEMSRDLLTDPVRVLVKREEVSVKVIAQYHQVLEKETEKLDALCALYDGIVVSQAIVFCNTRKKVEHLGKQMKERGFAVTCIHGEMTQIERESVMAQFRLGATRVLITTDVLGRGIDVQQVTLVVNYDLPLSKELYIHRIGRAGRWGRKGIAVSFCVGEEREEMLRGIEKYYKIKIPRLPKDLSKLEQDLTSS